MDSFDKLLNNSLGIYLCKFQKLYMICMYLKRMNMKIPKYLMYKIASYNIDMCLEKCIICQINLLCKYEISFSIDFKQNNILEVNFQNNYYVLEYVKNNIGLVLTKHYNYSHQIYDGSDESGFLEIILDNNQFILAKYQNMYFYPDRPSKLLEYDVREVEMKII